MLDKQIFKRVEVILSLHPLDLQRWLHLWVVFQRFDSFNLGKQHILDQDFKIFLGEQLGIKVEILGIYPKPENDGREKLLGSGF